MKNLSLPLLLLILFPLPILAQYGGGNGRGEILAAINTHQLNGRMLAIYGGGNGRGEIAKMVKTNQLNGNLLAIYGGGNGRGEIATITKTNQLNGRMLAIYGGGNGRGEILKAIGNNQLNGKILNLYSGGNGRGEIVEVINSVNLNGGITLMYRGGNGRGETNAAISTVDLEGVAASIYMGGNGRGETMFQLNNQGLPAQVTCFGALQESKQNRIFWQTINEKDCDYFTVEKSTDKKNWQPIGVVNSAVNSHSLLSYQLFDPNPVEGTNYYQLKITSKEAKCFYTEIAVINYHVAATYMINVFPNPVKSQFTFAINGYDAKTMQQINVSLLSAGGQTILQKQHLSGSTQTVDISNAAAGTYYLLVDINGVVTKVQVVKE